MLAELMEKKWNLERLVSLMMRTTKNLKFKDLTSLAGEWDNFWDDLTLNDKLIGAISNGIPSFNPERFDFDTVDDQFVQLLWSLREEFF